MQPSIAVSGVSDQVLDVVRSLLGDDRVILGAVVLLVVLLVAWYTIRRVRRSPGSRLQRVFADQQSITLLLHPNPDPDAMASAMGLARLAEDVGTDASIAYPGEIRHQENRAFRTVLGLDLVTIEADSDIQDEVVLVDHNEVRGVRGEGNIDPIAVVDHHPGDGKGRHVTDVRPEYGACATIVVEYLRDCGFEPESDGETPDKPISRPDATGLLYGILSDTNHLTRGCTAAEFEASSFLYPGIDEDFLDRIAHPEIDSEVLDVKSRAIENRRVEGPFVVSSVGELSNADAIPQAADELLHLEGVTAVVVMGQKDDTLHLSGRSRDDRVHMGDVLESAVEDIPMSGAGGHARMGGGTVLIDHMEGLGPSDGTTMDELEDRLFAGMAGES